MSPRGRAIAGGAAALGLGVAGAVLAGRATVRRHRARPDPEAEVPLGTLPPEDLGPVVSFDGTELAVRAVGPQGAPVLLFSHGILLDMSIWYHQWRAFSDRYRCVAFDHRTHGRSGLPPTGDYSLEAVGHDLRAVMDRAAPEGPVVLVGHSMGGMGIVSLAGRHPEEFGGRVAGTVLVDTAVSDVVREFLGVIGVRLERLVRAVTDRYLAESDRAEWIRRRFQERGGALAYLVARATNFGPDASPSQVDYVSRLALRAPVEVWTHMLRSLIEMDLREALAALTVPSLVVVGDRDTVTPKTSARALREALPDARAYVITGAGHVAMMERHRVFNQLLEEHLDRIFARERAAG